jgi:hypothetical protein
MGSCREDAKTQRELETEDDSLDAVLEDRPVEVHEKAEPVAREAEIRQDLGLMNREQVFHRLDFDDDGTSDKHVEPQSLVYSQTLVFDRKRDLTLDRDAS